MTFLRRPSERKIGLELRQLRYFAEVARHRHVTRAAESLGLAQPALSQQIRLLERELGLELLDRSRRQIELTEAGRVLAEWAERILADVAAARADLEEFAGLRRGRVVVGTAPLQTLGQIALPALLAEFYARYPGVEIILREAPTEVLLDQLAAGSLDLAIGAVVDEGPPSGIAAATLFVDELVAIVSPSDPFAAHRRMKVADLAGASIVAFPEGSPSRRALLRAASEAGFALRIAFETNEAPMLRALAAEGLGVAVVPRSIAVTPGPPIAVIELDGVPGRRAVALLWAERRHRSIAARTFLEFARARLAQPETLEDG